MDSRSSLRVASPGRNRRRLYHDGRSTGLGEPAGRNTGPTVVDDRHQEFLSRQQQQPRRPNPSGEPRRTSQHHAAHRRDIVDQGIQLRLHVQARRVFWRRLVHAGRDGQPSPRYRDSGQFLALLHWGQPRQFRQPEPQHRCPILRQCAADGR